jgi:hypothetical protein
MTTEPQKIEDKQIKNEAELREMLKNYMPGSEAHIREVFMTGFEKIRVRLEAREALAEVNEEDYRGYKPAPLNISDSIVTLDTHIVRRMGGERNELTVQWTINGVVWVFDPWTGDLTNG